ncbi:MAG: N-6 DNA methylase, partial [Verrucomicrobia bacterium]|nr:N-6 DNA methylase [Verrucomicrobiota bacterium]
ENNGPRRASSAGALLLLPERHDNRGKTPSFPRYPCKKTPASPSISKSSLNGQESLAKLLTAFFKQEALTIGTAKDLAQRMAGATQIIRDLIVGTFEHETTEGYFHRWQAAFREVLIPDLDERQFADMFAQTLAYGLFAARVHTPPNKEFSREMAAFNLPKTNPFLRKLFSEIAGVDMPETVAWAVDDIVEFFKHADMAAILKDFGKGKGKEDPVVHFYETFLAAYDPKMRDVRGVYYTPEPVVSYIVRSVDHLLKTRFGRAKGLADPDTLILDPATGTATFISFVLGQIYQSFAQQKGSWDDYVSKYLLNRIFGFELLMAPYAIAHLKLGMQLEQTGYKFGSDQRLGIYLTNTLENAAKKSEKLFANWISDEANEAARIKRDDPILVVLGNPPYSGVSANKGEWIQKLIESYRQVDGQPLGERKTMLDDDYVKFIRFGQWRIEKTGFGILAFITNNAWIDNPTFRGMRQSLLNSFSDIYILNLHGDAKKGETCPDGSKDENVFAIRQGVAITLFLKVPDKTAPARIHYADLWGVCDQKNKTLSEQDVSSIQWSEVLPQRPFYPVIPQPTEWVAEQQAGFSLPEIFTVTSTGITTSRDALVIDFDRSVLLTRMTDFVDEADTDEEIKNQFKLNENYVWRVSLARAELREAGDIKKLIRPVFYRPFDTRFICFHSSVVWRTRDEVMRHLMQPNLALMSMRRTREALLGPFFAVSGIVDRVILSSLDNSHCFPLWLYPSAGDELSFQTGRRPNLNQVFLKALAEKLGLAQVEPHGLPQGITPEDIFHYAYAVFHSPTYRTRYAEFLKFDFPRLPLTSDLKLFRALSGKGSELVALHLMKSPKLDEFITTFPEKGSNVVEKVQYTDQDKRVWINPTQYFGGVPKNVWEFHIGGYQVCQKWLKDRKGRKLIYEDIQHYQKIIVVLAETARLMAEIDALIPRWPLG